MTIHQWVFQASVTGPPPRTDIVPLSIDLGWRIRHCIPVILAGISVRPPEMDGAEEARQFLASLLPVGARVTLHSVGIDDVTGRTRGVLFTDGPKHVAHRLVEEGYALRWSDGLGRWVPEWPRRRMRIVKR